MENNTESMRTLELLGAELTYLEQLRADLLTDMADAETDAPWMELELESVEAAIRIQKEGVK